MGVRVVSYNVLTGGRDEGVPGRVERLLAVLEREQPDLLALQECNLFEAEGHRVFHLFERRLGMRGLLGPAASGFHVALFVRDLAVVESTTYSNWCQHAMLSVKLDWRGELLEVFSVHLDPFSGTARLREAEHLAGHSRPDALQLVLGDFNAVSPRDAAHFVPSSLPTRYRMRQTLRGSDRPELDGRCIGAMLEAEYVDLFAEQGGEWIPTVPSRLIDEAQRFPMRVDYAFASRRLAPLCEECRVVRDERTNAASDHYPITIAMGDP